MSLVLLVEDEPDLRELVAHHIRAAGHEVVGCAQGQEGLRLARQRRPDLVLLDLMLPDMSGVDVCRQLRGDPATARIPVLMLTARSAELDRVHGFEAGADDYVVKPFSSRELVLRVRALLRRNAPSPPHEADAPPAITIDHDRHLVRVHGQLVRLTSLEFRLLATLLERAGHVQRRETLLTDVWGVRPDLNTRTVDTHVKRLRERLGDAGAYIHTIRGVGYCLRDPAGEDTP